ncbi:hypothetical protein DLAC_04158 [Tieghemostelium lacteum]|uniref:Uncharacterized protein n=1 Tax=Tieghemostelium lacteum TaxID=361077 RepID=A0A151ZSD5_TIELA|nr:hypothetical protein DLAC_04158 [Tieghemostelium lacteum]|eukprot:KYQ96852.1 hypothetical protein DLAC_04158 [Tieghemostelium lacteum]
MVELNDNIGIKIYVDHNKITIKGIELQKKLLKLFISMKIHHSLISIFDIADYYDIQKKIKDHHKTIPRYPYIEINGELWGEGYMVEEKLENVMELCKDLMGYKVDDSNEVVNAFMENREMSSEQSKESNAKLEMGILGSSLNLIEWLSYGLISNRWNPWSSPSTPVDEVEPLDDSHFECEVVRTNWYGRGQLRNYRFTPKAIYRLCDNAIRTTLFYNQIKELVITDKKNIIIKFKDDEDQYIQAIDSDINKIVEIVTSRAYLTPSGENLYVSSVVV